MYSHHVLSPLRPFLSFKSITHFQTKLKTTIEKQNQSVHQLSLLHSNTDVSSDVGDRIHARIPKGTIPFTPGDTSFSTITNPKTDTFSTTAMDTYQPIKLSSPCSQVIPIYDPSIFNYKNYFQGVSIRNDYSLELQFLNNNPKIHYSKPYILGLLNIFSKDQT